MNDRVGQVWLTRHDSIVTDFEPVVILRKKMLTDTLVGWVMRPLEHLADSRYEYSHFESQFALVERGGDDVWVKMRIC